MRYVRIFVDGDGRSGFENVQAVGKPTIPVEGVPPRRQWVIVLTGRAAITVSSGQRREFGPGAVLLFEDTTGEGHLSTPLTDDLSFAMIPHG